MASESNDPPASPNPSSVFDLQEEGHRGPTGIIQIGLEGMTSQANMNTSTIDNLVPLTSSQLNISSQPPEQQAPPDKDPQEHRRMDSLLATFAQQQALLMKQQQNLARGGEIENGEPSSKEPESSLDSSLVTPDSESVGGNSSRHEESITQGQGPSSSDPAEVLRLKRELEDAKHRIARMDMELSQNRITQHTIEQGLGSPSEADFRVPLPLDVTEQTISNLQGALNASTRGPLARPATWAPPEESRPDTNNALTVGPFGRPLDIWGHPPARSSFQSDLVPAINVQGNDSVVNWGHNTARPSSNFSTGPSLLPFAPQAQRAVSGPQFHGLGGHGRNMNELAAFPSSQAPRHIQTQVGRGGSSYNQRGTAWGTYPTNFTLGDGFASQTSQTNPYQSSHLLPPANNYQPAPIGTPLSPTAPEFTSTAGQNNPWYAQNTSPGQTYVSPIEPLNYRRLLDRTVNCNWKYIVDKIVCNNDQQASIFLQQKLKLGSPEQKYDIVEAIAAQAYPLMVNRFGNFLVQRCFEHGTPDQVIAIANAIRGNTLNLSMDSFGCHVVQKAFDCVPEDYKAIMVHELLRRIPETVIHRYACHVWQKLFELRWNDSPPQIMKYVNEALRGMWHEVALGETGSLVVQNIFENCLEEDKRPCINEVLASIDMIARGQFGNWCIQHICEQGMPADRSRAIDHVLRNAVEYSMDQFASKVVEKCLKIGGPEFLERYLERVCEGRPDRPRIPLVDIASDQYGNYLIQYILTNANPQHREIVASHVRKHMVSLRGSKFGAKVGMLCCNPAYATRPGPGVGPYVNRFNPHAGGGATRFGGAYR